MMDTMEHDSENRFLKANPNEKGMAESHKEYLGLGTPPDYFPKSKRSILNAVHTSEIESKDSVFSLKIYSLNRRYNWAVAASIIFLLTVSILFLNDIPIPKITITADDRTNEEKFNAHTANILVASLFFDDSEADQFIDHLFFNEIVSDVQRIEHDVNDAVINSLLLDDCESDEFLDEYVIESILYN